MLHSEYLLVLERARSFEERLQVDDLRGQAVAFLARRWVIADGLLTHILVPVLDSEQEVEVEIDEDQKTYSYRSPSCRDRVVTRPLSDITLYAINLDAWMDEICTVLEIEPSRRARSRELIAEHLWHLGDIRVGHTHRFAPIYLARRIDVSNEELRQALLNAKRPSQGIVLLAHDADHELPNSHQTCGIDRLLVSSCAGITYDAELFHRLLKGIAADADDPEEYFDTNTGELKLACVAEPKTFKGKQKNVIAMFWKARQQHSLKWSDVMKKTSCGKDPDSVFGPDWSIWLDRIEGQRGHYRLRTRQ